MNAGTFTQITADSGYAAKTVSGSSLGRNRQEAGTSFADVFTKNLQDSGKPSGAKAAEGKQDAAAGSKAQNAEKQHDSQAAADQGMKAEVNGDGSKLEDSKAEAAVGTDAGESGGVRGDKDLQQPDGSLNLEEAMSLQAMMAFWQNGAADLQTAKVPEGQAVIQPEPVLQPVNQDQVLDTLLASMEGQDMTADRELMQNAAEAAGMSRGTEPEMAGPGKVKAEGTDTVFSTAGKTEADGTKAEKDGAVYMQARESDEEPLSDMQGRQDLFRTMGREQGQVHETDEESGESNQVLEELKRNAQAKGLDLADRLTHNRLAGSFGVNNPAKGQEIQTPVMEQLRTGLEQNVKAGMKEFTVHLKPEGLGDIVIHMANAGEKMTVRIGVTNPETEKLVTSQMESLKEMLRPLNAEVAEVYRDSQGTMDFAGYNQQMQEHRGQQARSEYRYYGDEGNAGSEEDFLMEAERMMAESRMGRLYAYV